MKTQLLLAIFITGLVFISGCASGPSCPTCQTASSWSACDENAMKTRTNYKCGSDTSYECQSYTEQQACKTELSMAGTNGLAVVVSPTMDEIVKGTLKITINSIPSEGNKIWVLLGPQGLQGDPFQDPNTRLQTVDSEAGKTVYIDTTKIENGVYNLGVMTTSNPGGAPWTDVAQVQLVVEN